MINPTFNVIAPKNTDSITTATICTERVTLDRSPAPSAPPCEAAAQ